MNNSNIKLIVFDLDGTLLRGDTVCLTLARRLGHTDRMLEFEGLRDMAEIEAARYEMAEWYRPQSRDDLVAMLADARTAPGAEEGCALLRANGVEIGIASMTWTFGVELFAERVGAAYWTGTDLDFKTGRITHSSATHKADFVQMLLKKLGLRTDQAAAVGDTWGDVDMLNVVGHRFFVGARTPDLPGIVHVPDADIRTLAQMVVGGPRPQRSDR